MTDRVIVFPDEMSSDTDLLLTNLYMMQSIGFLIAAFLGTGTWVDGFACAPGSGLTVTVAAGAIFSVDATDATGYGSLGTNAVSIMKEGHANTANTFSVPAPSGAGQSINYLIQAKYADTDVGSTLLSYYDASDPDVPYSGPGNDGIPQNTIRASQVILQVKAGTAATTGSQTTPAPDAGFTPLWDITVDHGETSLVSGDIVKDASAPFIPAKLGTLSGSTGVATFNGRSGTVVLTQGDVNTAIGTNDISNAMLDNMGAGTVKANVTGGSASPADVSLAAFRAALGIATSQIAHFQSQSGIDTLSATTWTTRTLDTQVANTISGCSQSGGVITLSAGTYRIDATSVAYETGSSSTYGHKLRLRNNTGSSTLLSGQDDYHDIAGSSSLTKSASLSGVFTLSGTSNIEIDSWVTSAGYGETTPTLSTGEATVWTNVVIQRIA